MPDEAVVPKPEETGISIPIVREMAAEYGFGEDVQKFRMTLIHTVFPSDKTITHSQFLMFVNVAKKYKLDPLAKQIFAFPNRSGGIVPVVSIDGWIALVQREANYNGHKFIETWKDDKIGGDLLAVECLIYRKDLEHPISMVEYMVECYREDSSVWKKWPRRFLHHKAFCQAARYAFGLSGIYDEDEASRIIEAERVPEDKPEIQMPQRKKVVEEIPVVIEAEVED